MINYIITQSTSHSNKITLGRVSETYVLPHGYCNWVEPQEVWLSEYRFCVHSYLPLCTNSLVYEMLGLSCPHPGLNPHTSLNLRTWLPPTIVTPFNQFLNGESTFLQIPLDEIL